MHSSVASYDTGRAEPEGEDSPPPLITLIMIHTGTVLVPRTRSDQILVQDDPLI